jgi:hypothetical protein
MCDQPNLKTNGYFEIEKKVYLHRERQDNFELSKLSAAQPNRPNGREASAERRCTAIGLFCLGTQNSNIKLRAGNC